MSLSPAHRVQYTQKEAQGGRLSKAWPVQYTSKMDTIPYIIISGIVSAAAFAGVRYGFREGYRAGIERGHRYASRYFFREGRN